MENLFSLRTIEKARAHKAAFVDIDPARTRIVRGEKVDEPERWTVNEDEKSNLCHWVCDNGSAEDFANFQGVFDLLRSIPGLIQSS